MPSAGAFTGFGVFGGRGAMAGSAYGFGWIFVGLALPGQGFGFLGMLAPISARGGVGVFAAGG